MNFFNHGEHGESRRR